MLLEHIIYTYQTSLLNITSFLISFSLSYSLPTTVISAAAVLVPPSLIAVQVYVPVLFNLTCSNVNILVWVAMWLIIGGWEGRLAIADDDQVIIGTVNDVTVQMRSNVEL